MHSKPSPQLSRRTFFKTSTAAAAAAALGLTRSRLAVGAEAARVIGANDAVRVAVIGLGGTETVGGVGGRGHQLIASLQRVPGVRIAALCDVDQTFLPREAEPLKMAGSPVTTHTDLRRVLEDKSIDAVVIALPNHWHALATVWACQAGKDVYVEKPFSHGVWEGRQMVAAARKHGRMVQTGTQNRSSTLLRKVFADLQRGELGRIRFGHAIMYRARAGIGKPDTPVAVPPTIDYDLWCGPAPKVPLRRKQLHYEWHWFWDTGNGEIGNNGVHMMDVCRLGLGHNAPPPRTLSVGGRFASGDAAETPNTQIALFDYPGAPMICEVRNLRTGTDAATIGNFRGRTRGLAIDCEGGYFAGESSGGAMFDRQGRKIRDVANDGGSGRQEVAHLANWIAAIRSRKAADLACEAIEGHHSAACAHLANLSHRLGKQAKPEAIRERIKGNAEFTEAFERCREYLRGHRVDLGATPAVLGPWISYDEKAGRFTGEFAKEAAALDRREYRAPFVVPEIG